jgi:ABC-type transport system involved in cytochrome c biogenesis permease subunit
VTWAVYAAYLALRYGFGVRGRRAAYLVIAGFVLVAVARLALPVTHFS